MGLFIWLVVSTPLKNMKVNWDDYSQYMEKQKMFQTTNQVSMNQDNLLLPSTNWQIKPLANFDIDPKHRPFLPEANLTTPESRQGQR